MNDSHRAVVRVGFQPAEVRLPLRTRGLGCWLDVQCDVASNPLAPIKVLTVPCKSTSLSTARLERAQDRQHEKAWRNEKIRNGKGVGGRRAYSSSSVELSPDPPDPSPSFESIGFLMTLFWTTGGGPVEEPSGGGGPRAEVLRAGAPATTAPPLVGRHLELAGRELDAALGTLLHVDGDPGLAVRALRHVFLEFDAALRARRGVLRDEGAAFAALDHLAESEDFPVEGDANPGCHRRCQDD